MYIDDAIRCGNLGELRQQCKWNGDERMSSSGAGSCEKFTKLKLQEDSCRVSFSSLSRRRFASIRRRAGTLPFVLIREISPPSSPFAPRQQSFSHCFCFRGVIVSVVVGFQTDWLTDWETFALLFYILWREQQQLLSRGGLLGCCWLVWCDRPTTTMRCQQI